MNMQEQPRLANGFGRQRVEKETGYKLDNKSKTGKTNSSNFTTSCILPSSNKGGGSESLSCDRLVYLTTCLVGHHVEVQVTDGSVFSGIFHATNADNDFGVILKMARSTKGNSSRGQKNISDSVNRPPSKTLIIPARELVQIIAKDVSVSRDGLTNDASSAKHQEIMIDSSISQSRHVDAPRELERWVPDDDNPECPELDNIFDGPWNRGWDQFEANAALFGVKSTFDEDLYTTKLDRGPQMQELEKEALRIAREIEGEDTKDLHLAEERGLHLGENFDIDEETRYSSVFRGGDDGGYAENEDDSLDSHNMETFGGVSDSVLSKSFADMTNDGAVVSTSSSSLLLSEVQKLNIMESQSTLRPKKESSEKGALSSNATSYAPSHVSFNVPVSGSSDNALVNRTQAMEESVTRAQQSSSTSASDCDNPAVAASSRPRLSPSSSVGSLSSERSTLNPHAKEFKFNPNAKSFIPSQTPLRPTSPVSDGSFYYPSNVGSVPHMHVMPVGIGMGPLFAGHHPVMFNPQAGSMQTPPTYFHPNGPQYEPQMMLGRPRQLLYIPNYPPEMPYKGR